MKYQIYLYIYENMNLSYLEACKCHDLDSIKSYLPFCNIHYIDKHGCNALHYTVQINSGIGNMDCFKLLISKGVKIIKNKKTNILKSSILDISGISFKNLLENYYSDIKHMLNNDLLKYACKLHNTIVIKILIKLVIFDVNLLFNILYFPNILDIFLKEEFDINVLNVHGNTILMEMCDHGCNIENILKYPNINLDIKGRGDFTALEFSLHVDYHNCYLLIDNGASLCQNSNSDCDYDYDYNCDCNYEYECNCDYINDFNVNKYKIYRYYNEKYVKYLI